MTTRVKTPNAVSKQTEKILLKMLDYLEAEPKRLEMGDWGSIYPPNRKNITGVNGVEQPMPPCRTTACLAGTCLLVTKAGKDFLKMGGAIKENATETMIFFPPGSSRVAADILELTEEQRQNLFHFREWTDGEYGWPYKFSQRYTAARTARGRFSATKARVLHFIKTGE